VNKCDASSISVISEPIPHLSAKSRNDWLHFLSGMPSEYDVFAVGDSHIFNSPMSSLQNVLSGAKVFKYGVGGDRIQQVN
jgi:hypothetical protein